MMPKRIRAHGYFGYAKIKGRNNRFVILAGHHSLGDRSFWVKNLLEQPKAGHCLDGKRRDTHATVFADSAEQQQSLELPPMISGLSKIFTKYAEKS